MKCELKELSLDLNLQELYDMYQDIPNGDNGQSNFAYRLSKNEFKEFLIKQIERKNNDVTYDDTPTITYIMYVNKKPVGFICLRTKIDDKWLKWSGNFYYQLEYQKEEKDMLQKCLN